jgi:hypothetical protein
MTLIALGIKVANVRDRKKSVQMVAIIDCGLGKQERSFRCGTYE